MDKLLKEISDNNILLEVVEGKLKLYADAPGLTPELIFRIRERKSELIQFLLTNSQDSFTNSFKINIPAIPIQPDYALSSSQRRLWALSQLEEGNIAYNMPGVFVFEGALDRSALERSFMSLIERHEILRTVFTEDDQGDIKQMIVMPENTDFRIRYEDVRDEEGQEEKSDALIIKELMTPFDLAKAPLMRAVVLQVRDDKWIFSYVMHHIISDGWSMNILIKELLLLYAAYAKGQINPLSPLRIQYKDYAAWQQLRLSGESVQQHKTYWLQQLAGELPVMQLQSNKGRPAVKTYKGGAIKRRINPALSAALKSTSREYGCTLFMGLLGVVLALLYNNAGQEDIIIGTPLAGREHPDFEDQIGLYLNTLALRTRFKGGDRFHELLGAVKQVTLDAYEHQMYPFDELIDALALRRDASRNFLFDVWIVLNNTPFNNPVDEHEPDDLKIYRYERYRELRSRFDLLFSFNEVGEELDITIEYNSDILEKREVDHISRQLESIMNLASGNPGIKLLEINECLEENDRISKKEHLRRIRMNNLMNLKKH